MKTKSYSCSCGLTVTEIQMDKFAPEPLNSAI